MINSIKVTVTETRVKIHCHLAFCLNECSLISKTVTSLRSFWDPFFGQSFLFFVVWDSEYPCFARINNFRVVVCCVFDISKKVKIIHNSCNSLKLFLSLLLFVLIKSFMSALFLIYFYYIYHSLPIGTYYITTGHISNICY